MNNEEIKKAYRLAQEKQTKLRLAVIKKLQRTPQLSYEQAIAVANLAAVLGVTQKEYDAAGYYTAKK